MRVLMTGAAGHIGSVLRERLAGRYDLLRLSDVVRMAPAGPGEEVVSAELSDISQVMTAMDGIDAVIHLGGIPGEDTWENILRSNIEGTYNVFEAARLNDARRIVFASSNHAVGFYRRDQVVDHLVAQRPDTRYGLSKAFGEDLASLYVDKHRFQVMCMRIGSFQAEPKDARQLATWMSYGDMTRLVATGLAAPDMGFAVVYGISRNTRAWWDNAHAYRLGYDPQDNAEDHADRLLAVEPPEAGGDVALALQGGIFPEMEFDGDLDAL
ncbi:MAG: NAD(P)-dependent oxidoreductase [Salaquimonas sp.]|nr:NAD(P)-dependent oxidoreductase [Salaquimonas sp.]